MSEIEIMSEIEKLHTIIREREAEVKQLKEIIYQMPGNVYWSDKEGYYLGCNHNIVKLVNGKSDKDIIGKTLHDLFDVEIADKIGQIDKQVMYQNNEQTSEETAVDNKGNKAIYLTRKIPLTNGAGEVRGLLGISFDITAQKEAEKLRKEKKIAEATINRLTAVAGSIAHQITNPLASVKIAYEFIQEVMHKLINNYSKAVGTGCIKPNIADEDILRAKQFDTRIDPLIHQTNYIINHHLTNIKENSWHTHLDWTLLPLNPHSMASIVEKALAEYPFIGEQKRLLIWNKAEDFEVLGEVRLLVHVITNLLSNAFASIELAGKGNVTITLEKDRSLNYLHIKDTGEGLPREGRSDIFKPFHTSSEHGTGLGLYFCKSVMQGYYGDISCKGKKGGYYAYAQFTLKFLHCDDAGRKFRKKVQDASNALT